MLLFSTTRGTNVPKLPLLTMQNLWGCRPPSLRGCCFGGPGPSWKTIASFPEVSAHQLLGEDGWSYEEDRESITLSAWESTLAPTGPRGPAPPLVAPG